MNNFFILQAEWVRKEKEKIEPGSGNVKRKPKRQYLHFDDRIKEITQDLLQDIFNADYVAKHPFFPFIREVQKEKHYKRQPAGSKFRTRLVSKERPIDYSAHKDALILSWYAFILSSKYELLLDKESLSDSVIAYRATGKSTYEQVKVVTDFLKVHPEYVAVALDVEKFFQKVDHQILKSAWEDLLGESKLPQDHFNIFKYVTDYRYVNLWLVHKRLKFGYKDHRSMIKICDGKTFRSEVVPILNKNPLGNAGIPQGSSISCVLSNIYMLTFDRLVSSRVRLAGGLYFRYSDDILCLVPKSMVREIADYATTVLRDNLKLNINAGKTEMTSFAEVNSLLKAQDFNTSDETHLSYLGITFDGQRTYLRHKAVARHQKRAKAGVESSVVGSLARKQSVRRKHPKYLRAGKSNTWTYADRVAKLLESQEIKKQTSDKRLNVLIKKVISKIKKK